VTIEHPTIDNVPAGGAPVADDATLYRSFNRSVVVSGIRCTLTYLVLPYLAPAIGLARGVGPVLGLLLGTVALVANVFTIRRFWVARHRYRWVITGVSSAVIVLLLVMAVRDIGSLLG
jgi:hypothetical protein